MSGSDSISRVPIVGRMSDGAIVLTLLAVFGGLGFVFGRHVLVVLVFLSPIVIFSIWFKANHRGPDDDVTGPVAGIAMFISCAFVLIGVSARWVVYGIARLATRDSSATRPRQS
jgi:hypothetical protein